MTRKSLSKEELIAQLKALSQCEVPKSIHMGAMCYEPACPPLREVRCESCGKIVEEHDWMESLDGIKKKVAEIKMLGYDVKVEHLCAACATKLGLKDEDGDSLFEGHIYNVFYFKTMNEEQYHVAESSDEDEYKAVLAFLKNEPTYTDYYDATHLIKDELDVIKKLTGISIE